MIYKVVLKRSDEGIAVWAPGLPGCASQGADEEEALSNIKAAIEEYLSVLAELQDVEGAETRTVTVNVA